MLYDKIAHRYLSDFRDTADRIIRSLSKEELELIIKHGYESWKQFGLDFKAHLKGNDPVFIEAIEQTEKGIANILRGNLPIDPARLLRRYLMKLQVGLLIRKKYAAWQRESESTICVFDTPEYEPAAKLLVKKLNLDPSTFAIPQSSPGKNEHLICEILKTELPSLPICGKDLTLLYDAVDYVKALQATNVSDDQIRQQILDEVELAKREIKRSSRLQELSLAGGSLPIWHEAAAAIGGSAPEHWTLAAGAIWLVVTVAQAESAMRSVLSDYSSPTKFLVAREILSQFNPRYRITQVWLVRILSLARRYVPRPKTKERVARQMMEPWIENPVWYDPATV